MATSHSIIGASGMHRWAHCPGSVRLSQGLPHRTTVYAEEGTLAHEIASELLSHPERRPFYEMTAEPEMLEAIQVYLDVIEKEDAPGRTLLGIEHAFDMSFLFPGLFGTTDAYAFYLEEKLLRIYDYKHGKGKAVDVEDNEQLLYYALGALLTLPFPVNEVELVIVQPRLMRYGRLVHRHRFPMLEKMLDFTANLLEAARATEAPDAPLVIGNYCFFCPAVGFCPAQHQVRNEKAKTQFSPMSAEEAENLITAVGTTKKENPNEQIENGINTGISGELSSGFSC